MSLSHRSQETCSFSHLTARLARLAVVFAGTPIFPQKDVLHHPAPIIIGHGIVQQELPV
jgi:hypothetical protein